MGIVLGLVLRQEKVIQDRTWAGKEGSTKFRGFSLSLTRSGLYFGPVLVSFFRSSAKQCPEPQTRNAHKHYCTDTTVRMLHVVHACAHGGTIQPSALLLTAVANVKNVLGMWWRWQTPEAPLPPELPAPGPLDTR